jgi:hypothetical protein
MHIEMTKGTFGYHLAGGKGDPHAPRANIQIFVRSSALSRSADLAISPHLMSAADIDRFVDDAIASLQTIRADAKQAIATAGAD